MEKWIEEESKIVLNNYGKKPKEWLIDKLNNRYTWEAIKQKARKLKVTTKRKTFNCKIKWTDEKIKLFKELWVSGTTEEISERLPEFTKEALTSAAKRFSVSRGVEFKFSNKLIKLLEITDYNYYWLGFIMADGHLSLRGELQLRLSVLDIEHLRKLSEYLNVPMGVRDGDTYGIYTSNDICVMSVMDVKVIKEIKDRFSVGNNKTLNPCSVSHIKDKNNLLSFFCGFVDGDGCITNSPNGKANMLRIQCHQSWVKTLTDIGVELSKYYNINFKCSIDKSGYARFVIHKNKDLLILKSEIDKLNLPYLYRKWSKIK